MSAHLNDLAAEIIGNAVAHGFRGGSGNERPVYEHVALIHTEVSEIMEAWRDGMEPAEQLYGTDADGRKKPVGIPSELADVIIRVLNMCGEYEIDIERALDEKMAYNVGRPHLHGRKRA